MLRRLGIFTLVGLTVAAISLAAGAIDPSTAEVDTTGLQAKTQNFVDHYVVLDSGWVVFSVEEASQGSDLNADGDMTDSIAHAFNPVTDTVINTMLPGIRMDTAGDWAVMLTSEAEHDATDLNGDGDTSDFVVSVFNPATNTMRNTGLAGFAIGFGSMVAIEVDEADQGGIARNFDGDAVDRVLALYDPSTDFTLDWGVAVSSPVSLGDSVGILVPEGNDNADWNGDGDTLDFVVAVADMNDFVGSSLDGSGGMMRVGSKVAFGVSEAGQDGTDLNGDGDTLDRVVHLFDATTMSTVNTGLASVSVAGEDLSGIVATGDLIAFRVPEAGQGNADLNADGDMADAVLHVVNTTTAIASNTTLDGGVFGLASGGGRFAFNVRESAQANTDLNGDADMADIVLHVFDPATGVTTNVGLASRGAVAADRFFAFEVKESDQGNTDINVDGDLDDGIIYVYDPASATTLNTALASNGSGLIGSADFFVTGISEFYNGKLDLNGDGDFGDAVSHIVDPVTGDIFNLGIAAGFEAIGNGAVVAIPVSEPDQEAILNGDGDELDRVMHVVSFDSAPGAVPDSYGVVEGGTLVVNGVLDNDIERQGQTMAATKASDPAHGTLTLNGNGTFTYVHDGSETTSDGFTYTASDGKKASDPATVTITITPVNDAPIAVNDGPFTVEQAGTLNGTGLLGNDTDAEGSPLTAAKVTDPAHGTVIVNSNGTFTYVHDGSATTSDTFTYKASDGLASSNAATVTVTITPKPTVQATFGLVDPAQGQWHLRNSVGEVTSFFFGNPGDYPIIGDWDCNGTKTPGMYRQSDGFVYLRNSNSQGIADIRFFFGDPGDVPLAGDFNGDGCDTVSIYRPSEGRFFIINKLGANEGGLGAAEVSYFFGDPGDKPFVGDFNNNNQDTVGLHRESTGLVYFRQTHTQGVADAQFIFGDPGDRLVAGDWNANGEDTPAIFRPSDAKLYQRFTNTEGNADAVIPFGQGTWLPVAGQFGLG